MKRTYIFLSTACILLMFAQYGKSQSSTSLKSRIIYTSLKNVNFSEKIFNQIIDKPKRNTALITPGKISRKLKSESREKDGFNVLTVYKSENSGKHIILLHGGAYVAKAVRGHRKLIEKFALSYSFKVTFIDYPLAPENNALTTLRVVEEAYRDITNTYPNDTVLLFGDSAGGGLALALLQTLQKKGDTRMPIKTALVSPWLDLSMSNTDINKYVDTDVVLNLEGLSACANLYADKSDLKDPLVSPIYGNMDSLHEIKIWVSDIELFYPDCILLDNKLNSAYGSSSSLSVMEGMIHDWVIMPIKERDKTISEIINFYNSF